MTITAGPPLTTFMSSETQTWILSLLKYINNNKISSMKWFEQCVMVKIYRGQNKKLSLLNTLDSDILIDANLTCLFY